MFGFIAGGLGGHRNFKHQNPGADATNRKMTAAAAAGGDGSAKGQVGLNRVQQAMGTGAPAQGEHGRAGNAVWAGRPRSAAHGTSEGFIAANALQTQS